MRLVRISGAGVTVVNGLYRWRSYETVPKGFADTCTEMGWFPAHETWKKLAMSGHDWLEHENGSYIYLHAEGQWWIDEPSGKGVYIATADRSEKHPPIDGWKSLISERGLPLPTVEHITQEE